MREQSPGEICYKAWFASRYPQYQEAVLPWSTVGRVEHAAWEAAAQAVLRADSDGRHTTTAFFRYAIGDLVRLGTLGPWTVCSRRWIEREIMPAYAEYLLELEPEGTTHWEVEADLTPWDTP